MASERQMARLQGSTAKLEGGFRSAQLQTGRLGNQFASLAGQIAGVHPIVGNLAQVMGNFAVGGLVTVGILGATAIFAKFYDVMTKGAREAKKASDELIASLEKSNFMTSLGPEPELRLQTDEQRNTLRAQQQQRRKLLAFGVGEDDERILELNRQILHSQTQLEQGEKRLHAAYMAAGKGLVDVKVEGKKAVDGLKFSYNQLRNEIEKTRHAVDEEGKAWWTNFAMKAQAQDELAKILGPILDVNVNPGGRPLTEFGTEISGVDTNIGLTKEQIKTRDELVGTLDKNTFTIRDAIWGAASQSASMIVGALNLGGGGKGSSLGGALGGTAGFVAGMFFGGPIGGAIGSTVGSIAGSLLGGLFDNKKAVNANTSALRALTNQLLYAPAGFRAESYRYNASDPRPIDALGRNFRWNASRGGANPLLGT